MSSSLCLFSYRAWRRAAGARLVAQALTGIYLDDASMFGNASSLILKRSGIHNLFWGAALPI
jgi:hypothetical protein